MTNPLYDITLLGFEAASVINKRLARIALGGSQSIGEINMMVSEKVTASIEATCGLMTGATVVGTIARLREIVAANEARLSAH